MTLAVLVGWCLVWGVLVVRSTIRLIHLIRRHRALLRIPN